MAAIEHNRLDFTELSDTAVCEMFAAMHFVSDDEARKNLYRALLVEIERRGIAQTTVRSITASVTSLHAPKASEQKRAMSKRSRRPPSIHTLPRVIHRLR